MNEISALKRQSTQLTHFDRGLHLSTASLTEIIVPELGLKGVPICVSNWLAEPGTRVLKGDAVVELLVGDVSITLSATSDGVLNRDCVEVDQVIAAGQCLATLALDFNRREQVDSSDMKPEA